tara:strand:+ start:1405 stop:1815 length:411 start_codon:yes stop_codon:yes gene_type:complete
METIPIISAFQFTPRSETSDCTAAENEAKALVQRLIAADPGFFNQIVEYHSPHIETDDNWIESHWGPDMYASLEIDDYSYICELLEWEHVNHWGKHSYELMVWDEWMKQPLTDWFQTEMVIAEKLVSELRAAIDKF